MPKMSRDTKLAAGALAVVLLGVTAYMLYKNYGNVAAPPPHRRAGRAGRAEPASADSAQGEAKETEDAPVLVTSGGGPPAEGPQSAANPTILGFGGAGLGSSASQGGANPTPLNPLAGTAADPLAGVLGQTRAALQLLRPQIGSEPSLVGGDVIGLDMLRDKLQRSSGVYKAPKFTQHTGLPS